MSGNTCVSYASDLRFFAAFLRGRGRVSAKEVTEDDVVGFLAGERKSGMSAATRVIVKEGMSVARTERYIEQLLLRQEGEPRAVNVGAFLSNLNQSLARIQRSGIGAISERRETEDEIVLTITIPK